MVDPSRAGVLPATLHELLHLALHDSLLSFGLSLDETIVRRLEEKLWQRHFKPDRVKRWRRLIRKAQKQCLLAPEPPPKNDERNDSNEFENSSKS